MGPANDVWHAPITSLPTTKPVTPNGTTMAGFPREPYGPFTDPLQLDPGMNSSANKTITWTDAGDPMRPVTVTGDRWASNSDYTFVERTAAVATGGVIRHHRPDDVLVEGSSTDYHALFVDTDACTLYEYLGWDLIEGRQQQASIATVTDLERTERRISSRPGWAGFVLNGPLWIPPFNQAINSPLSSTDPNTPGPDGVPTFASRNGVTASAGSGLPSAMGQVRIDEVFTTPSPGDQTVDRTRSIDHAIGAVIPMWNVTSTTLTPGDGSPPPFVWPATRSDGCGGGGTCTGLVSDAKSSAFHIPMGSRLRLSAAKCNATWTEPQAAAIAKAMCTYGIIVTDSSNHFAISPERSPDLDAEKSNSKWRAEARRELATLTLRDFDLVDSSSMASIDPTVLWKGAQEWSISKFGPGALPNGWYEGTFWKNVITCDRAPYDASSAVRPPCEDPILAKVDAAVNSPLWSAAK